MCAIDMYICVYTYTHKDMERMCMYVHACMFVCVCVCVYACVRIHSCAPEDQEEAWGSVWVAGKTSGAPMLLWE